MAIACEDEVASDVAKISAKKTKKKVKSDKSEETLSATEKNGENITLEVDPVSLTKSSKRKTDDSIVGHVKKKKKVNARKASTNDNGHAPPSVEDAESRAELMQDDDIAEDDIPAEEKYSDKEASRMSGKSLRNELNSANGLTSLKKFVTICNENKKYDLVSRYLDAGGNPLEILRLLDSTDKKNLNDAVTVFSGLEIVIMKILDKYPHYHASAAEACRHLINSNLSFIHSMLSSQSNAKQRRVVLRLLTAVAALGGTLPRELLGHLSLHPQVLDALTKLTNPNDSQSVRTCFIHFILAFLVEGNISVVRALLDKRGVIASIIPDLLYDRHQIVHMVLSTIKSYVLENPGISKTIKLHTFSTPVVRNLVALYNWKGPRNWSAKHSKKPTESSGVTDPDEKKVVTDTLHDFLLTLLTSKRLGIIFHDRTLGVGGQRNNQLVNTILQSLERPWEHEKPSDLVVKILVACPDLIRSQLIYTEPYLEPRESVKWGLLMEFIGKIIESLDPEVCVKPSLSELITSQLVSAMTTLTIPLVVLKNAIAPSLDHKSAMVRHTAIKLLLIMLKQLEEFLKILRSGDQESSTIVRTEHLVMDYVLKNVPSLDSIISAWNKAILPETKKRKSLSVDAEPVPPPTRKESLTTIIDLLLSYQNVCPRLLETSSNSDTNFQPTTFLSGLNTLSDIDARELNDAKVKVLKFLLALDSSAFSPEKALFGEALPFLASLLDNDQDFSVNSDARTVMRTLLSACGLFEGSEFQLDVWIKSCFDIVIKEERIQVAEWLVNIVREVVRRTNKYVRLIAKAEEAVTEQIYNGIFPDDVFSDLMTMGDSEGKDSHTVRLQPPVTISPLLLGAIENLKSTTGQNLMLRYLSHVTIYTLHCQVAPNTLKRLVEDLSELPSLDYIASWSTSGNFERLSIKKPLCSKDVIFRLSKGLLCEAEFDLGKIFHGGRKVSVMIKDKQFNLEHSLNTDDILASLRLSVFYFTQLTIENKLTEQSSENLTIAILALLHIAQDVDKAENANIFEDCLKWIFTHPIILRYFSPLYKKKNLSERSITNAVSSICSTAYELHDKARLSDLIEPFKDKLMNKLLSAVAKCKNGASVKGSPVAIDLIELMQLSTKDIIQLLSEIIKLPVDKLLTPEHTDHSMWSSTVSKLLDMSSRDITYKCGTTELITLNKSHIQQIATLIVQPSFIANEDSETWISSLLGHLQRFPHNIDGIDKRFFKTLMNAMTRRSAIDLASFLVSKNTEFVTIFVKHVLQDKKAIENKEAVFAILSNIHTRNSLEKQFLEKLYEKYKTEIIGCLTDPTCADSFVKEKFAAIVTLIETTINSETCNEICEKILSSGDKLMAADLHFVKLLESIFRKAGQAETSGDSRLIDFVQILIHVMVSALKKYSKDTERLNELCKTLENVVKTVKSNENGGLFYEVQKNHSWPQFTRFSLKLGLKLTKERETGSGLLKTLADLCDVVYENDCDDEYPKLLFEMTTSHSEFINVMLGSSDVKRDLVMLLGVLVRKNNSLMTSIHVPLYLGAYNATLSETDQLILQLLQYYESHNIRLTDYRPFLWGSAASSHYSVKSGTDTALWRQPSTSQVLDLFVQEMVTNTVTNYPIDRTLQSDDLYPAQSTYDPAFFLPLLCYLLSDNSAVACHKITQSGALALALSACGSTSEVTRLAAYTVISRFYYHLEATSSREKLLWMHFIDLFRNGIASSKHSLNELKLSSLVTTFMARTSMVATQPLNPLYSPLQNFLMAKPSLNLESIPEFLQLFHSSEIEHKVHRRWILEVIRDGIRSNLDMEITFKSMLFKMLLDFYTSILADDQTKLTILQVINSAVKIPKAAVLLVTGYGLLSWLHEIVQTSNSHDSQSTTIFINIASDLLNSLSIMKEKRSDAYFMLLKTMINLKSYLSRSITIETYTSYIKSLGKILFVKSELCRMLSSKDMSELIQLSQKILGEINECVDILTFGAKYVPRKTTLDFDCSSAKEYLKFLIITWCSHK